MFKNYDQEQSKLEDRYKEEITSKIGDPFARQTKWTPQKRGGTKIRTHKLFMANPNRMEFKPSFGAKLFYLSFLVSGIGVLICFTYFTQSSKGFALDSNTIVPLLVAIVFIIAGSCLYYFGTTPIVFDKHNGFFWKGRKTPDGLFDKEAPKQFAKLKTIHALQLISECVKSDKKSYDSYELNIVLQDGRRINIVDHGKKDEMEEDAETLSTFLGKPVWKFYD